MSPLLILATGVIIVLGMIIFLRINAFVALITAAMVVSVMAPGEVGSKISRVADAFGRSAGAIGIVIALAAIIGQCMMESGAADRIVRTFLKLLAKNEPRLHSWAADLYFPCRSSSIQYFTCLFRWLAHCTVERTKTTFCTFWLSPPEEQSRIRWFPQHRAHC